MYTSPGNEDPRLGSSICLGPIGLQCDDDDGMTLFRGILVAGAASLLLWGICIVTVIMLRS